MRALIGVFEIAQAERADMQAMSGLDPQQILLDSATDLGRERYFQGFGLVDVLRSMQSI